MSQAISYCVYFCRRRRRRRSRRYIMPPISGRKQIWIDGYLCIPVSVKKSLRFLRQFRPGKIQCCKHKHPQRVALFHPDVFLMFTEIINILLQVHREQSIQYRVPLQRSCALSVHRSRLSLRLYGKRGRIFFRRSCHCSRFRLLAGKNSAAPPPQPFKHGFLTERKIRISFRFGIQRLTY